MKRIHHPALFWTGIALALFLAVSYVVVFDVEAGANYVTTDRLLGMLIFHNPFILALYLLVAVVLIMSGTKRTEKEKSYSGRSKSFP